MQTAKNTTRCLSIALLGALLALPVVAQPAADTKQFHTATTEAEKKLDTVIRESERDPAMTEFLLNKTPPAADAVPTYVAYFTPALLASITNVQGDLVKKDCGEKPAADDDEICGIDSDPVSCTQDDDEKPYIYRTVHDDGKNAEIIYRWQGQTVAENVATYRLVKAGGNWVIDGIACPDLKFNMK